MELNLRDKTVLISGSAHGLGKSIARAFLDEGSGVIITDIDQSRINDTINEFSLCFEKNKLASFCGDLTKPEVISECLAYIKKELNEIDICIANLGSGRGLSGWNVPGEEWERMMNLNFCGARRLASAVIPGMIERGRGSLLFVSSIAGLEVIGAPIQYSVAKASLIAYSKNLASLLGKHNIRVNTVCPGNIFFKDGTWDFKMKENSKAVLEMLEKNVPLNRFSSPEEIADLVLFLSSERASFITGSCIVADGGQTTSI